jgi:hypothetical protein
MKTVALGPWMGELGWYISTWVPAMRWYARTYTIYTIKVVVPTGLEFLVNDFAGKVISITPEGKPDRWLVGGKKTKPVKDVPADSWVIPDYKVYGKWRKIWRNYSQGLPNRFDVCIHARIISNNNTSNRNWSFEKYKELVALIKDNSPDCRIASIGSFSGATFIPGTEDGRSNDIYFAVSCLAGAKLCLGPSSGPMHLASHCATPHLVWTDNKVKHPYGVPFTNRERYERLWNPLNTPVKVVDKFGWQPPVQYIFEKARKFL